jgi:hypothetical protein
MKTFMFSLAVAGALAVSSGAALACDYGMKDSEAAAPVDVAKKPTAVAQKSPATTTVKKAVSTAKPSVISAPDKTALSTPNVN